MVGRPFVQTPLRPLPGGVWKDSSRSAEMAGSCEARRCI